MPPPPVVDKQSPDYWARMCWTNTVQKLHIDFDIAFFGDSITRGSDFQLAFPDKKIINLGYSGDNIIGMLNRVSMIEAANPKEVFIMAGTNDLVHINLSEYKERYTNLILAVKSSVPGAKMYIQSVLPSNHEMAHYASNDKIQKANQIVKSIAEQYDCTYIDLYSLYVDDCNELPKYLTRDGVHLYPQSYDKWEKEIEKYVYE